MPTLSRRGHALMGAGGVQGSLDGQPFPFASYGGGAWVDDETAIVALAPSGDVALWKPWSGEPPARVLDAAGKPRPANQLAGGGGRYLAFLASQPDSLLYGNTLGERTRAGAGDVAVDGTMAFKTVYQADAGLTVITPGGVELFDPGAVPSELQALPGGQAIYRGGAFGRPPARPFYANAQNVKLVAIDGVDHLVYWSEGVGLVLQVDGDVEGFVLESRPVAFNHDAIDTGYLTIAWSLTQGEGPQDLVELRVVGGEIVFDIDPEGPARVVPTYGLLPAPWVEVPRIGKPCLVGWFTDVENDTPGNADLWVDYHGGPASYMVRRRDDGRDVLRYVAAEVVMSIESLETAVADSHRFYPTVPVVAYWVAGLQGGRPPRNAEYVGVEAYRLASETPAQFEARVRAAVGKCQRVMLVAQCYTSNMSLTADLASVVPAVAAVARDCSNIFGILPFSAGTRATGWSDHPEVYGAWEALCDGVTGIPNIPPRQPYVPPIDPPVDPVDPERPHPFTHRKGLHMDIDGKTIVLRGPKGMLMRPDAPGTGVWGPIAEPKGTWRGAKFDVTDPGDTRAHYLAKKLPSGRYTFRNVQEDCFAGIDGGQYIPDILQQFYHKNTGNPDAGDLEQMRCYDGNENGAIEAQTEHVTTNEHPAGAGHKFFAYPLAVEVV